VHGLGRLPCTLEHALLEARRRSCGSGRAGPESPQSRYAGASSMPAPQRWAAPTSAPLPAEHGITTITQHVHCIVFSELDRARGADNIQHKTSSTRHTRRRPGSARTAAPRALSRKKLRATTDWSHSRWKSCATAAACSPAPVSTGRGWSRGVRAAQTGYAHQGREERVLPLKVQRPGHGRSSSPRRGALVELGAARPSRPAGITLFYSGGLAGHSCCKPFQAA